MKNIITTTLLCAVLGTIACVAAGQQLEEKNAVTKNLVVDPGAALVSNEIGTVPSASTPAVESVLYDRINSTATIAIGTSEGTKAITETKSGVATQALNYGTVIDRSPTSALVFGGTGMAGFNTSVGSEPKNPTLTGSGNRSGAAMPPTFSLLNTICYNS